MNAKMPETGLTNQNYIDYLVDDFNRDLIKLNAAYDAVSQLNLGLDYNRYLNIDTKRKHNALHDSRIARDIYLELEKRILNNRQTSMT